MTDHIPIPRVTYTFHRVEGFYPLELRDDADARRNAKCNPGTLKVVRWPGEIVVWKAKP